MAYDEDDAGQVLLRTAAEPDNNALYSIEVTYPTGEKRWSQGRVFGAPENVGNADSIVMANPTIELSKKVVKSRVAGRVDAPSRERNIMYDITQQAAADTTAIHIKGLDGVHLYADADKTQKVQIVIFGPGSKPYAAVEARQTNRSLKRMQDNDGKPT
ncbi:hypothetical protein LTR94_032067, partial [Friedmanniomyces endolithicus]